MTEEHRPTTYVGAEFATDLRDAEAAGTALRLTSADVEAATGVELVPGHVIEYRFTGNVGEIRVVGLSGEPGPWVTVELRGEVQ